MKRSLLLIPVAFILGIIAQSRFPVGRLLGHKAETAAPPILAPSVIPASSLGKLRLYLLAGQSNMSGRAPVTASPRAPNAYVFGNDYRWHAGVEPTDSASAQVDVVSLDANAGTSPGIAFAQALQARSPGPVGLIPCAKGSTRIADWQRNLSDGSLYGSMLKRANAARSTGTLAGLVWLQGEDDTRVRTDWKGGFERLVADLRQDLGAPLPVLFAQIGTTTEQPLPPFWADIQAQQAAVRLPNCWMVRTSDLPLWDEVHFTADGERELGKRWAGVYGK